MYRLMVDGKDNGIHGVLVRIRDEQLNTMPGEFYSDNHLTSVVT